MKVDNLLAPYLYQFKKLSLPGIGLFTLDDNAVLPDDNAKIKMQIEGISFSGKTGAALDDSLIQYIKDETGKMKALAEADLYSFIATAFQFLNIGKPFYFEGIGTLQKNKDGGYTFTAGTVIPQKTEEIPSRYNDPAKKSLYNNDNNSGRNTPFNSGKLFLVLGIVLTLGLIGWGGYYLYSKNAGGNNETSQNDSKTPAETQTATPATDTSGKKPDSTSNIKKDSMAAMPVPVKTNAPAAPAGNYKFILESTDKKTRALKRYEQLRGITILKEYNNKVALETKDSLSFKIYTILPCAPADTARVKELLNTWYYGKKEMKVKIDR